MEQLPFGTLQAIHPEEERVLEGDGAKGRGEHVGQDRFPFGRGAAGAEDPAGKVAGEPDPGREDEVTLRAVRVEPPEAPVGEEGEIHQGRALSWSRSFA